MPKESLSTQQIVEIENIKDGTIILKNGALRRVLMVSGINFDLKSEEEQNVINYAYQGFLNTLDFSIQIMVHSRKLNIGAYLENLKEREDEENNELIKNQISEYAEFIKSFVQMNEITSKTFFVIVPYDPIVMPTGGKKIMKTLGFSNKKTSSVLNIEQQLSQLDQRTYHIVNGLNQLGLRAVILNDEELTEFFYNLYNPSAVEKKDIKLVNNA